MEEPKNVFLEAYDKLNEGSMFGIKRLFIPIKELRKEMGLSKEDFESIVVALMNENPLDSLPISLHGGLTSDYEKNESIEYKGKKYLFVSVTRPLTIDRFKKKESVA